MKKEKLSRREFLATVGLAATALATGTLSSSCSSGNLNSMVLIAQNDTADLYPSYKDGEYQVKDFSRLLKDEGLGLSPKIIDNHLGLYKNYIKKVNKAEKEMREGIINEFTLKNLAFSLNGMVLHDIYFSNMNTKQGRISNSLRNAIEESFGSYPNYLKNLLNIALKVKGWSITGVNLLNGKLINYGLDTHSDNYPSFMMPILALDVYEHAYVMDFGEQGKPKYLEQFQAIVDWDLVSRRFDSIQKRFK